MIKEQNVFFQSVLVPDEPVQINGAFNALEVMEGAHAQLYLFGQDPGTAADLSQGIRLDRDGMVVMGPFVNPWVLAVGATINENAGPLRIRKHSRTPAALVANPGAPPILTRGIASLTGDSVAISGEKLIGQILYGTQVVDDGQQLHERGWFTGYAAADGDFRLELRARSIIGGWDVLAACPARERESGRFTVHIDLAGWDPNWVYSAPTTWGSFTTLARLPVPHAPVVALYMVNPSGASALADVNAYVGIRSS